jgi:hypothetical protein
METISGFKQVHPHLSVTSHPIRRITENEADKLIENTVEMQPNPQSNRQNKKYQNKNPRNSTEFLGQIRFVNVSDQR